MRNQFFKYCIIALMIFLGHNCMAVSVSSDTTKVIITNSGGLNDLGQNREDDVPYEAYVINASNTLEIISYDTKPATLYLCDAAGNIVNTLYIPEEGFYSMPVPSGYSHMYIMIYSTSIFYGEVYLY